MTVEAVLFTRLSTIVTLVANRVYPLELPQGGTLPAVTYQKIDGPLERAMGADHDVVRARYQIDSWASDYAGVKAVAAQVSLALENWRNKTSTPAVINVTLDSEGDMNEPDVGLKRVRSDYIVWHRT